MNYRKIKDSFHICIDNKNYSYSSVWMIASKIEDRYVLMYHGSEYNTKLRLDQMTNAYNQAGFYQDSEDLYLLDATQFGEIEINKCINITNYIGHLINADKLLNEAKKIIKYV